MNNIRIMHTISRFYGTKERMTVLYMKITNQMIKKCKQTITDDGKLWDQDKLKLIENIKVIPFYKIRNKLSNLFRKLIVP